MVTISMDGRLWIGIAGGISRFGPKFFKGEALSENTGSDKIMMPFFLIKKVEWPIQIK